MLGLILRVTQTVTSAFSALKIKYNLQIQRERNKWWITSTVKELRMH